MIVQVCWRFQSCFQNVNGQVCWRFHLCLPLCLYLRVLTPLLWEGEDVVWAVDGWNWSCHVEVTYQLDLETVTRNFSATANERNAPEVCSLETITLKKKKNSFLAILHTNETARDVILVFNHVSNYAYLTLQCQKNCIVYPKGEKKQKEY